MKKNIGYTALILFLIFTFIGLTDPRQCSSAATSASLLSNADQCRKALYKSVSKMKYRHNWLNCIGKYKITYTKYSSSSEAPWAMFRAAGMYLGLYGYSGASGDLEKGLELYRNVVDRYTKHRVADDAQYRVGEIFYKYKKDSTQAYVEFLKVEIKFPSGDMKPKAQEMMDKLSPALNNGNGISQKVVDVSSSAKGLVAVKDIRHWSTPTYTRVVVDVDGAVKYAAHLLKADSKLNKPRRLYMDLERTFVSSSIDKYIPIKDGLLQTARAGQYNKSTVRVVLDINNMDDYKIFHLYDPFRIVVDVKGGGRTPAVAAAVKSSPSSRSTSTRPVNKGMKKTKSPDGSISLARQLGLNVERIVIDPGHGGKDPGCSFKGVYEKDIVLKLAKVVKSQLEKNIGCEVFLTRNTDIFLPLDERTAFANVKRADLFVSLHVNAHKQSSVNGIETYYLNMATDEEAVMVAARENATSQKNISDLQGILNDLMLNTKITESSKLAYDIQNSIIAGVTKSHKTIKNLGVKQAPFYVLIGAEMPAILIETGFITNYTERQRLQSDRYYDVIARSIVSAIDTYIKSIGIGG